MLSLIPSEGGCLTTKYNEINRNFHKYFYLLDNSEAFEVEFLSPDANRKIKFPPCSYQDVTLHNAKEESILPVEFISDKNTYNIKLGGDGGWDHMIDSDHLKNLNDGSPEHIARCKKASALGVIARQQLMETDPEFYNTEIQKLKRMDEVRTKKYPKSPFYNWKHTDESKKKIGKANRIHQQGSGNSQYGTRWIYNTALCKSKRIKSTDPIPSGWKLGRKVKF